MDPHLPALRMSSVSLAALLASVACGPRLDLGDPTAAGSGDASGGSSGVDLDASSAPLDDDSGDSDAADGDSGLPVDLPTPAGPCTAVGWGPDGKDDIPGSVLPTHGYWAWDRCCVTRPVIHLLEDTPVLDVDGADELPLPRLEATIDPDQELVPPLQGEYAGHLLVATGGHPVAGSTTIEILEPISPGDAPVMGAPLRAILRFGPALHFGPFTASYCPALEPTDPKQCECGQ
jgi:hypothetical protein